MTLTPEQKQALASWLAAGDNLSVVQKKLTEQFKLSITYMELRFLVDDLGFELKNAAPKADASDVTKVYPPEAAPQATRVHPPRADPPAKPGSDKKGLFDKLKEKVTGGKSEVERVDPDALDEDDIPPEDLAEDFPAPPAGASGVKVDLDRIVRPGAVASGSVTFSDGASGKWAMDQYGRLMLDTGQLGYQPSAPDVQAFQRELSAQLQRHGF